MVKNPPANAGDTGLIPGSGRSPGEGNSNATGGGDQNHPQEKEKRREGEKERYAHLIWRRKWQLNPVLLLGESQGRGSIMG